MATKKMKGIKINELIDFLKEDRIPFKVINTEFNFDIDPYYLSSIQSIREYGIYYLMGNSIEIAGQLNNSVLLVDQWSGDPGTNFVVVLDDPKLTHYKISKLEEKVYPALIHPTSIISPNATIGQNVYIGPYCIVEDAIIGDNVRLLGLTHIFDSVSIGDNTTVESNCSLGVSGMAWAYDTEGNRVRQTQLGGVIIGYDCFLGSDISIVRGSVNENTIIGDGTVIAHGTKIGHGSHIGKNVHFANNVSIAGNAIIDDYSFLGSGSIVSPGIKLSRGSVLGAGAVLVKSFERTNITLVGVPAKIIATENHKKKMSGVPKLFNNKKLKP